MKVVMNIQKAKMMWLCVLFLMALSNTLASEWIKFLPGYPTELPFKLKTGYVGVEEGEDVELFYYFVESEKNPQEDPLLLWQSGGPGCSPLLALTQGIGPMSFDFERSIEEFPKLMLNPYSWTKFANIIFFDQPVGTGFSYSKSDSYETNTFQSAKRTYSFLRKWLIEHPKYAKNPLYMVGDSFGGTLATVAIQEILDGINMGDEPQMNLKGYVLGNPMIDRHLEINSQVSFGHRMALLSDELYESAKTSCKGEYVNVDPKNTQCATVVQTINKYLDEINLQHILEIKCSASFLEENALIPHFLETNIIQLPSTNSERLCRISYFKYAQKWVNDMNVRKALHVQQGAEYHWVPCSSNLPFTLDLQRFSVLDYHHKFTKQGLRALIYSGDHDLGISYVSTEAWIKSLNLSIVTNWDPWFVDGQVAGYTMVYSNHSNMFSLTYATVKGAGHVAPQYKPEECYFMARRWFADQPL